MQTMRTTVVRQNEGQGIKKHGSAGLCASGVCLFGVGFDIISSLAGVLPRLIEKLAFVRVAR
jgi:hypothetical protein